VTGLGKDLRYGARMLCRNPGATAIAVLSLALGIGANTAIFSLIDVVLLRMLPVKNPEQLLLLGNGTGFREQSKFGGGAFTYPSYKRLRERDQWFADLAAFSPVRLNVSIDNSREPSASGQLVSGNYYGVLGVNAVAGRTLTAEDDRIPSGHPVAVISHGYWKRRFALNPSAIGRSIRIDGTPFTIVGVTPPEFFGLEIGSSPDISVPIMMQPVVMPDTESWLEERHMVSTWLRIFGRLKPGMSEPQALAGMSVIYQQITSDYAQKFSEKPAAAKGWLAQRLVFMPGSTGLSELRRQFSKPLFILMTVVALVLFIACANLANLLLAKALARQREMAVRVALGAPRTRLMRQLLTESLLLTSLGGILGLLFAVWGSNLLVTWMSLGRTPIVLNLRPDVRVLAFTAVACLATGILLGLAPAVRITQVELGAALKDNARSKGGAARVRSLALSRVLLIAQVAMSLVLLIGAGLFVRSFQKLNAIDLGFSRENVLLMRLEPRGSDMKHANLQRLMRIYADLLNRMERMPGVRSASLAGFSPLHHSGFGGPISIPGYTPQSDDEMDTRMTAVYPNYFATVGIPVLLGRDFDARDMIDQAAPVAVINESMARHFFLHQNPIGRTFDRYKIIGVVKDAKYNSLRESTPNLAYMPYQQTPTGRGQMTLHVRITGNTSAVADRIREEVLATDKDMPAFEVQTVAAEVDASIIQEGLIARLAGFFGILALLLVSIGLYGLVAYSVTQRTGEIGIRMALGAQPADVMLMVIREVLLLVFGGLVCGVAAAAAVTRVVSTLLFGLTPNDPFTFLIAMSLMVGVASFAAYLPARKASRIDPMIALRYE